MPAPHPPLPEYYEHESQRGGWVKQLFDRTAVDYDRIERFMALGSGSWYRRRALSRAGHKTGMRVLDIGVGTGLTARQADLLVGETGQVTGVDPSAGMMARARLPRALLKTYMRGIVPYIAQHLAADPESPRLMRYYWDTIEACAPPQSILQAIRDAGFVDVDRYVELGIFSHPRTVVGTARHHREYQSRPQRPTPPDKEQRRAQHETQN